MRGQTVVCKDFTGGALIRITWEDSAALVFVHTDDQFTAHQGGLPHLAPVGFPIEDVFIYNEEAVQAPDPWSKLTPYEVNAREGRSEAIRGGSQQPAQDPASATI
jgi:hypothetical protein